MSFRGFVNTVFTAIPAVHVRNSRVCPRSENVAGIWGNMLDLRSRQLYAKAFRALILIVEGKGTLVQNSCETSSF